MGEPARLDGEAALAILRSLPLALTVVDANGRLRYVNDAAAALFGTPAEALVGGAAAALTVAAADTAALLELSATVDAGRTWMGRFPLTAPDGRRVEAWFASSRATGDLVSVGGEADVIAASVVGSDPASLSDALVTRTRAEAEEANRLLTTLLDAVPVGMAFFDRDRRYVRVNRTLAEIDGLPPEAHLGMRVGDVPQGMPASVDDAIAQVLESGETVPDLLVSGQTPREPGTRHWIASLYPVRLRGRIEWVGLTAIEVTEWRRAEEERVRLLVAEQRAREAAEQAAERLARLQVVTARLAEATTVDCVADIVLAQGADALGASGASLFVADSDGKVLDVVRASSSSAQAAAPFSPVAIDAKLPVTEAVATRELVVVESREDRDARWPALAGVSDPAESSVALPLYLDDRLLGAITLHWAARRDLVQADRDFIVALGRQCVLALERVRLYEAERAARDAAEVARERMAFLAEASRVLGSSLDHVETLARLANLAVREIADVATILLAEDGGLRLAGLAHHDPGKIDLLVRATTWPVREPRLLGRVAASGVARVVEEVTPDVIAAIAQDPEHEEAIHQLELGSMIIAPLVASNRVLGVLSLGSTVGRRRYTQDDLGFVEDLAARVAVAVENARVHAARTEVARTLQQSLLPPVDPVIPGLEVARRYHSAGEVDVGGDFFDVFPSGDGRWGVVMGDVCGRGVGAAALTALARYTVRAGAIDEGEPSQVLRLLNRAILDTDTEERFCTITHAVVEPDDDGARVTLACGGHPLPLLLRAEGTVEEVGVPGTAIGLFEELDISETKTVLAPGDALVFFTDGLTEARAPDGRFAPDLIEVALRGAAGGTAEQLATAIDRAVLTFEGGQPRDDMALLILRVPDAPRVRAGS